MLAANAYIVELNVVGLLGCLPSGSARPADQEPPMGSGSVGGCNTTVLSGGEPWLPTSTAHSAARQARTGRRQMAHFHDCCMPSDIGPPSMANPMSSR